MTTPASPAARPAHARAAHRRAAALGAALLVLGTLACGSKGKAKQQQVPTTDPNAPILTAQGSPTGDAVAKSIGTAGGSLASADGRLTVVVPAGAVAAATAFSVQPITSTAIGGVGGAFRVEPHGVTLAQPVTLVLRGPESYASGTSIADLGVAYQDASGFWFRVKDVQRDANANTLTVTTRHFSDWGVVWQAGVPGLYGSFTLQQTIGIPFSASGTSTLFYQGDSATTTLYVATGSLTVPAQVPWQGGSCAPDPATLTSTLVPTVAEIRKSPAQFRWSINGQWSLACTDSAGQPAPPQFMSSMFDSMGINLVGCTRGYVDTPLIGSDHLKGTYAIDCGAQGKVTATWDLVPCIPGVLCASPTSTCNEAVISCTSGQPVCTDTGRFLAAGTGCGANMVCDPAGACVSCTAGTTCTPGGDCTRWETSCATGAEVCVDTNVSLGVGTSCGTDLVCNDVDACVACSAGLDCTPAGSCTRWATSCASGASVCTDTGVPLGTGASCGTNMVCNASSACVACTAGTTCTPAGDCTRWETSCSTGAETCVDTNVALGTGASCGTNMVCDGALACVSCTSGVDCTPAGSCTRHLTSCSTGASVCVDTGQLLGTGATCGTNMVCSPTGTCVSCTPGTSCTPDGSCTLWQTGCGTGAEVCSDTSTPLGTGASCGAGRVCDPSGQCIACVQGEDCTPANACTRSRIDCSSGAPVCTVTAEPVAPGTTCGAGLVCDGAGACIGCSEGLSCTPLGSCFEYLIGCSTGAPVCSPTATPVSAGTSCGSGLVCDGVGACVTCVQDQDCTVAGACLQSRISCASGGPVCTPTAIPVTPGTVCGAGQVCDGAGQCVACVAGTTCTPAGVCTRWETSCASGSSQCVDTGVALGTGASCGTNQVCDPTGQCVACVQGDLCTPAGACVQSRVACNTGSPVCSATTEPVAAGTSCGDNQVCDGAGACIACTPGAACTPAGACSLWTVSCGSGYACSDTGQFLPAGTSCGTNLVCDGSGACQCDQGALCTPVGACLVSQIECGSGAPVCTETTTAVQDGTPCGPTLTGVCAAGVCTGP